LLPGAGRRHEPIARGVTSLREVLRACHLCTWPHQPEMWKNLTNDLSTIGFPKLLPSIQILRSAPVRLTFRICVDHGCQGRARSLVSVSPRQDTTYLPSAQHRCL